MTAKLIEPSPPKGRKRNADPNAGPPSNSSTGSADQRVVRQRVDNNHGPPPHLPSHHDAPCKYTVQLTHTDHGTDDMKPMHSQPSHNNISPPNHLPHPTHLNIPTHSGHENHQNPPSHPLHPSHPPQHPQHPPAPPPPAYWDHPSAETVVSGPASSQPSSRAYDPVASHRQAPSPAAPFRPFTLALGPSPSADRNVTLENVLEPVLDTDSRRQSVENDRPNDSAAAPRPGPPVIHYPDPVNTGLFSELEARALFKQ